MRTTLAWRLAARYLFVLAAVLAASAAFQYFALRHFLVAAAADQLTATARQAGVEYSAELAAGTPAAGAARDVVDTVVDPRTRAWVVAPGGAVVAAAGPAIPPPPGATPRPLPDPGPPPRLPARTLRLGPQRYCITGGALVVISPLSGGAGGAMVMPPAAPGAGSGGGPAPADPTLLLAVPLAEVLTVLTSEVRLLIAGGVAALLVGGGGAALSVRRALRPLHMLTSTADRIAGGDIDLRAAHTPLPALPDEVGRLTRAFDAMVDRLSASIEEERATHREMRRFLDDASHEMRTPLAALSGTLEVLQGEAGQDPAALRDGLRTAYRQARRLAALVSGLLALARAERPGGLAPQPVDLRAVLAAVRPAALRLAADHRLTWTVPDAPLPVLADGEALGGAVLNVLDNAVRYSPVGSDIAVDARSEGDAAEVAVTDHGRGIPEQYLARVFDRFFRVPPGDGAEAVPSGTGLGLAIVRSVLERHGGAATVESRPGAGTIVRLRLPLCPAAPAPDRAPDQTPLPFS